MSPNALATRGLTRRFGDVTALDSLDLEVPVGGVVGLIGPNGSGKSTLIRVLLGLIRPTVGTAELLGTTIDHPARVAGRIGALVENPAIVPALSGRRLLRSLAELRGIPRSRIDEVLDLVDLRSVADRPARTYSLGMKQRLGIAAAMLSDPELLILDEPTNGLDPAGIVEIRDLLIRLGQEERTVVVSSHLLAEIEAACDRLVLVRHGHLLFNGPTDELLARARPHVAVSPEHPDQCGELAAALEARGWRVEPDDAGLIVDAAAADAAELNRQASTAGITLARLVVATPSLEDVFLGLTGAPRQGRGDDAEVLEAPDEDVAR